jgi:hypothetical protein
LLITHRFADTLVKVASKGSGSYINFRIIVTSFGTSMV